MITTLARSSSTDGTTGNLSLTRARAADARDYGQPLATTRARVADARDHTVVRCALAPPYARDYSHESDICPRDHHAGRRAHVRTSAGATATPDIPTGTLLHAPAPPTHGTTRRADPRELAPPDARDDMPPNDDIRPRDRRAGRPSNIRDIRPRDRRAGPSSRSSPILRPPA